MEDIMQYLEQKKIMDVQLGDIAAFVEDAAQQKNAEKKILSEDRLPEKEFPLITIDPKCRFAKIRLYPPSNGGMRISSEEILDRVEQMGIKSGLLPENIKLMLKGRLYCTDVLIARATPPVQ
ncbi:flagellar assembly protein A [Jutongia sp.]